MAEIIEFPFVPTRLEKIIKRTIDEHYSGSPEHRLAAEKAYEEVCELVKSLKRPLFSLNVDISNKEQFEEKLKIAVEKFAKGYTDITTTLISELFAEKVKSHLTK